MLFLHITSRVASDPYQDLLQKKGGRGFPYLVFMDDEGNVLAKHQGARTVEGFKKTGAKVAAFMTLKKAAADGDVNAKAKFLGARMDLGHVTAAEAKAEVAKLEGLDEATKAALEKQIVGLENNDAAKKVIDSIRKRGVTKEQREEAGAKLLALFNAGKIPTSDQLLLGFWQTLMPAAEKAKDAKAFEAAYNWLFERYGKSARNKRIFDKWKKTLDELKKAADDGDGDKDNGNKPGGEDDF